MSELFKNIGDMPLSTAIYTKAGVEEFVNSAVAGGVTSLLKFVGVSSTDPTATGPTVEGISAFAEGNVVLWKPEGSSEYSEYVYATVDGALKWERLGDASRIGQLENLVATKADTSVVEGIDGRLTTVEGAVATKAESSVVTAIDGRVTTAEGEIDALQAAIATKAETSVVEGIDGRVTTAEGEIDALQAAIATKADAADVVDKDLLMVFDQAGTGGTATIVEKSIVAQTEDGSLTATFMPDGFTASFVDGQTVEYASYGMSVRTSDASGTSKTFTLTLPTNGTVEDEISAEIATSFDIEALQTGINDINDILNLKADASIVTEMDGRLSQVINEVATKADSSTVEALDTRVVEVEGAVATKAESSVVEAIDGRVTTVEGAVATKAESSVVEGIDSRLSAAEGEIDALQGEIANKADAADVVPADKLLVLTESDDGESYYAGSRGIQLTNDASDIVTITPDMGIRGENSDGSVRWGVESAGLYINGVGTVDVYPDTVALSDGENRIELHSGALFVSDVTTGTTREIYYPAATGTLATEEAMAEKYDTAADIATNLFNAAGTATTSLANVTTVNELVSVLSAFFGTFSA